MLVCSHVISEVRNRMVFPLLRAVCFCLGSCFFALLRRPFGEFFRIFVYAAAQLGVLWSVLLGVGKGLFFWSSVLGGQIYVLLSFRLFFLACVTTCWF